MPRQKRNRSRACPVGTKYLSRAGRLHEIGLDIAHTGYHKHSAYILENADMPGFSRKEQTILAQLVIGHRGDLKKMADIIGNNEIMWCAVLSLRPGRPLLPLAPTRLICPPQTQLRRR